MWVMVSGPYRSGAASAAEREANLEAMNRAALGLFELGHVPVIGANMALPMIAVAGAERYDELMMPLSLGLAERCDAVLRVGGASAGADEEVLRFRERGCPVYVGIEDVPSNRLASW